MDHSLWHFMFFVSSSFLYRNLHNFFDGGIFASLSININVLREYLYECPYSNTPFALVCTAPS